MDICILLLYTVKNNQREKDMVWRLFVNVIIFSILFLSSVSTAATIEGLITDMESSEAIPHVTIQVVNTNSGTVANETGHYRLRLIPGAHTLKFSHIGHYPQRFPKTILP